MIIYLVDSPSKKLKYKKRYRHVLFTYGNINDTGFNEMVEKKKKRRKKWLSKKEQS